MKAGLSIILSSLILAAPVLAQDIEATATQEKPRKPKLICRAEKHIGSRVARPICATEAAWKADDEAKNAAAQDVLKAINDSNRVDGRSLGAGQSLQEGPNGVSVVSTPGQ